MFEFFITFLKMGYNPYICVGCGIIKDNGWHYRGDLGNKNSKGYNLNVNMYEGSYIITYDYCINCQDVEAQFDNYFLCVSCGRVENETWDNQENIDEYNYSKINEDCTFNDHNLIMDVCNTCYDWFSTDRQYSYLGYFCFDHRENCDRCNIVYH